MIRLLSAQELYGCPQVHWDMLQAEWDKFHTARMSKSVLQKVKLNNKNKKKRRNNKRKELPIDR